MTTMIGFFDKEDDTSGLNGYAIRCKLQSYTSVDEALKSSVDGLFVHVVDSDWKKLCEKLSKERVALRFTTSKGYPRSPPEGKHDNCFGCLKPTKNDGKLTEDEFSALVAAFSDINIVHQLCTSIPMEIRGLVACSTVHRLRALHILLQACIVEWGDNPEHRTEAIELLGCHPAPSSVYARPNRVGLFYRILADSSWVGEKPSILETTITEGLQQELGVNTLDSNSEFVKLVREVLTADNENVPLSWDTTKAVFTKLDKELGTPRGNGS